MKPHLISFPLCPFVQRAVIVLREKNIEHEVTYIDLKQPPDWFLRISPMGKVPALQMGAEVLFESAVIMEYLDEVNPPSLHPRDPLQKAKNRAWTEFASGLFFAQYHLGQAGDQAAFENQCAQLRQDLARVEAQVRGPYFNGEDFNLVDAAFAPFFVRNRLMEAWHRVGILNGLPRLSAWEELLVQRPSVRDSLAADFPRRLREQLVNGGGYAASLYR